MIESKISTALYSRYSGKFFSVCMFLPSFSIFSINTDGTSSCLLSGKKPNVTFLFVSLGWHRHVYGGVSLSNSTNGKKGTSMIHTDEKNHRKSKTESINHSLWFKRGKNQNNSGNRMGKIVFFLPPVRLDWFGIFISNVMVYEKTCFRLDHPNQLGIIPFDYVSKMFEIWIVIHLSSLSISPNI